MHSRRCFGQGSISLVVLASVVTLAGCGSSRTKTEPVGKLQMNLVGQGSDGLTYRLTNGTFQITGHASATLSTETNPDATVLSIDLPAATNYSILLEAGWALQRLEGGVWVPQAAALISANPASFTIMASQTTTVTFVFEVDGGTVGIGPGTLDVLIDVVFKVCGNGIMEGTEQCDDGNALDGDGCSSTCQLESALECNPLLQDCDAGLACYPISDTAVCASEGTAGFGQGCEFVNSCQGGLLCIPPVFVPGCADPVGCCTALCTVGDDSTCTALGAGMTCAPLYSPEDPAELQSVGACAQFTG